MLSNRTKIPPSYTKEPFCYYTPNPPPRKRTRCADASTEVVPTTLRKSAPKRCLETRIPVSRSFYDEKLKYASREVSFKLTQHIMSYPSPKQHNVRLPETDSNSRPRKINGIDELFGEMKSPRRAFRRLKNLKVDDNDRLATISSIGFAIKTSSKSKQRLLRREFSRNQRRNWSLSRISEGLPYFRPGSSLEKRIFYVSSFDWDYVFHALV